MPGTLTPLMRQYLDLKEQYKDCLLFFRLGDFYEMFFEDAVTASRELEIVLTGRDCGLEERAPMCGVPYHSVEGYINRLIDKGYKVAISEQMTEPVAGKGIVERAVVRVITPGTVIEETMLDERRNNYLLALYLEKDHIGLAYTDVSTGSFFIGELADQASEAQLLEELSRIQPSEILANDALLADKILTKKLSTSYYLQNYGDWAFTYKAAYDRLLRHFQVAGLDGFGCADMKCGIAAGGALLAYLEDTQKNALMHIRSITTLNYAQYMLLDPSTRRNLELTKPLHYSGSKKNTLLYLLDKTKTSMGGRMLRSWIEQPLQSRDEIEERLGAVSNLHGDVLKRDALRDAMQDIYDIERLCSKIAYGTVNARDCIALKITLERLPIVAGLLNENPSAKLSKIASEIDPMADIQSLLEHTIAPDPPVSTREGGMIRAGYHEQVDHFRDISTNSKGWITKLEAEEREQTGIKNLRVSYNKVFGYYIEVTKSYQNLVPYHYIRKQTLVNSERYITPALKEIEEQLLGAQDQLIALETKLFQEIRDRLGDNIVRLQKNALYLAEIDCYQSLAETAAMNKYVRPELTLDGAINIKSGRHPVVECSLKNEFVPNDAYLNGEDDRMLILTGPNMAGKSTYMRQIALIVLMAHIGSFVPAEQAIISVVDRIFTRVGAADDLAAGQSTFMVEMSEMANILHNSTADSLLLLDEIGRGTSTFDGLSIAWAVLEYIADKETSGAKTLFATHYHELTDLEGKLQGVKNYRTAVKEVGEDILFLHKVMPGGADKSFGIQVARLAGLPAPVLRRAKEILKTLEKIDMQSQRKKRQTDDEGQQLSLLLDAKKDELLLELTKIDVDSLSPLEALNALNMLHQQAKAINKAE